MCILDVWRSIKSASGNIKHEKLLTKLFSVKTVDLLLEIYLVKKTVEQYLQTKPFRVAWNNSEKVHNLNLQN